MSREAAMQNFPKEAREIYQKYLKFTQGEAFLLERVLLPKTSMSGLQLARITTQLERSSAKKETKLS